MELFEQVEGKWVLRHDICENLKSIMETKKVAEKREKELKMGIMEEYKSLETQQKDFGGIKMAVSYPCIELQFDLEKFKAENVELYEKYLTPVYKNGDTKITITKGGKQ